MGVDNFAPIFIYNWKSAVFFLIIYSVLCSSCTKPEI